MPFSDGFHSIFLYVCSKIVGREGSTREGVRSSSFHTKGQRWPYVSWFPPFSSGAWVGAVGLSVASTPSPDYFWEFSTNGSDVINMYLPSLIGGSILTKITGGCANGESTLIHRVHFSNQAKDVQIVKNSCQTLPARASFG